MKKLTTLFTSLVFAVIIFSQNTKWDLNGNNSGSTNFIGTTNSEALVFKTDNAVRLKISNDGNVIVKDLESIVGNGVVKVNGNGRIGRVDYPNDSSYFFNGNGTFSPLVNYTGWSVNSNFVTSDASKNVGIGITNPSHKLEVNGDAMINGHLRSDSLQVGDSSIYITSINVFGILNNHIYSTGSASLGELNINGRYSNSPNTTINRINGRVCIGTTSTHQVYGVTSNPLYKLVVKQGMMITGNNGTIAFRGGEHISGSPPVVSQNSSGEIAIGFIDLPGGIPGCSNPIKGLHFFRPSPHDAGPSNYNLFISTNPATAGNIGIGTAYPKFLLSVEGTIGARKVVVESANWCDFVFEDNYELMSYDKLRTYIRENKHLPHIPSEKEIVNNGIDVSGILKSHTQTIEESVLYILELEKQNREIQDEISNLKNEMNALKDEVKNLKKN